MTRVLPPTTFHSSLLTRRLAELDLLEGEEPAGDFAAELGQWMHFTDAIALSSVLESGMAPTTAQNPALREAARAQVAAQFERTTALMVSAITRSCTGTGGNAAIKLPLVLDGEVSYLPYRQFYEAHQRDMEANVEPLRVNLRAALAKASPELRKLAELDIVLGKILREREGRMLARVPVLLKKRFDALYSGHQQQVAHGQADHPAAWTQAGGWLAQFLQNVHTLLLAEADLRLQPSAGLLAALTQQHDHE